MFAILLASLLALCAAQSTPAEYAQADLILSNKLSLESARTGVVGDQFGVYNSELSANSAALNKHIALMSLENNHLDAETLAWSAKQARINDAISAKSVRVGKIGVLQAELTLKIDALTKRSDVLGRRAAVLDDKIAGYNLGINEIQHKLDKISDIQTKIGIKLNDLNAKAAVANSRGADANVVYSKFNYDKDYLGALSTFYSQLSDYFTNLAAGTPIPVPQNPTDGLNSIYGLSQSFSTSSGFQQSAGGQRNGLADDFGSGHHDGLADDFSAGRRDSLADDFSAGRHDGLAEDFGMDSQPHA